MNIQRSKLNIAKARRRVQMRSALLLMLGVCLVMAMLRSVHMTKIPSALGWIWTLMEMLLTFACFGGGAYLGLCVLDGDHRKIVPVRKLSRAQILWLTMLGALAAAPVSLLHDLILALAGRTYEAASYVPMQSSAFVQSIFRSVLLAPVCEELFFRGYLLHALLRHGKLRASIVTALCFALVHSLEGFVPLALFGMLLCLMTIRTGSLLAALAVHMGYNLTLVLLDHIGLSGLFMGWSLVSCALRLMLCAAFAAVLKRAYTARRESGDFAIWEDGMFTRREKAMLISCGLLMMAAMIAGG